MKPVRDKCNVRFLSKDCFWIEGDVVEGDVVDGNGVVVVVVEGNVVEPNPPDPDVIAVGAAVEVVGEAIAELVVEFIFAVVVVVVADCTTTSPSPLMTQQIAVLLTSKYRLENNFLNEFLATKTESLLKMFLPDRV